MEEYKEDAILLEHTNIPSAFYSFIINLENCLSHEEYMNLLQTLEQLAKTDPLISRAYSYSLSKYPNLPNVEPKTIAKLFREYWYIGGKITTQRLTLDPDSAQNLKKELRKTYHDSNIEFLANSISLIQNRI